MFYFYLIFQTINFHQDFQYIPWINLNNTFNVPMLFEFNAVLVQVFLSSTKHTVCPPPPPPPMHNTIRLSAFSFQIVN